MVKTTLSRRFSLKTNNIHVYRRRRRYTGIYLLVLMGSINWGLYVIYLFYIYIYTYTSIHIYIYTCRGIYWAYPCWYLVFLQKPVSSMEVLRVSIFHWALKLFFLTDKHVELSDMYTVPQQPDKGLQIFSVGIPLLPTSSPALWDLISPDVGDHSKTATDFADMTSSSWAYPQIFYFYFFHGNPHENGWELGVPPIHGKASYLFTASGAAMGWSLVAHPMEPKNILETIPKKWETNQNSSGFVGDSWFSHDFAKIMPRLCQYYAHIMPWGINKGKMASSHSSGIFWPLNHHPGWCISKQQQVEMKNG